MSKSATRPSIGETLLQLSYIGNNQNPPIYYGFAEESYTRANNTQSFVDFVKYVKVVRDSNPIVVNGYQIYPFRLTYKENVPFSDKERIKQQVREEQYNRITAATGAFIHKYGNSLSDEELKSLALEHAGNELLQGMAYTIEESTGIVGRHIVPDMQKTTLDILKSIAAPIIAQSNREELIEYLSGSSLSNNIKVHVSDKGIRLSPYAMITPQNTITINTTGLLRTVNPERFKKLEQLATDIFTEALQRNRTINPRGKTPEELHDTQGNIIGYKIGRDKALFSSTEYQTLLNKIIGKVNTLISDQPSDKQGFILNNRDTKNPNQPYSGSVFDTVSELISQDMANNTTSRNKGFFRKHKEHTLTLDPPGGGAYNVQGELILWLKTNNRPNNGYIIPETFGGPKKTPLVETKLEEQRQILRPLPVPPPHHKPNLSGKEEGKHLIPLAPTLKEVLTIITGSRPQDILLQKQITDQIKKDTGKNTGTVRVGTNELEVTPEQIAIAWTKVMLISKAKSSSIPEYTARQELVERLFVEKKEQVLGTSNFKDILLKVNTTVSSLQQQSQQRV